MAKLAQQSPTEHESHWSLPFSGLRIIQLRLDYSFGMEIGSDDSEFSLRINTAFNLEDMGAIASYSAERLSEIGPALRLFGAEIVDAKAFKNGHLEITFTTGAIISVEPNPQFESWEAVANSTNGMRIVAAPGGEVAVWLGAQL